MSNIDKLSRDLTQTIKDGLRDKQSAYDTQAEVRRIDGDIAWVHIPGGVEETPVLRTIDAGPGDIVTVRIAKGKGWIGGNSTNPPISNTTLNNFAGKSVAFFDSLSAKNITAENLYAVNGYIENLVANNVTTEKLYATTGYIQDLTAEQITTNDIKAATGYIGNLTADNIQATDIITDHAAVNSLDTNFAYIDFANVRTETVTESWIKQLMVQGSIIAESGNIYYLDSIHINANSIDAGKLKADRLLLQGNDGLYYQLNVDTLGTAYIESLTPEEQEELHKTIHADVITAGSITVDKITANNLAGTGGWINLRSGTFSYQNAETANGISWDGSKLTIKADDFVMSSGKSIFEELEAIETWFYAAEPTTQNLPASEWTTEKLKELHLRDIYFDTNTGKSYRWSKDETTTPATYSWVEIEDKELAAIAGRLSRAEATIELHSDNVLIKATQYDSTNAQGGQHLIQSLINVAPDGVKIASDKVEIDGTAIFNDPDFHNAIDGAYTTYVYDHDYEINNAKTIATFTARVYKSGNDVTNIFAPEQFTWYYKTEESEELRPINNNTDADNQPCNYGYTMPVYLADMNYGGEIVGKFTTASESNLLDKSGNTLTTKNNKALQAMVNETGQSIRVRDLDYTTSILADDGILLVKAEDERLINIDNLTNELWRRFDLQIEGQTVQQGNNLYENLGLSNITNSELEDILTI